MRYVKDLLAQRILVAGANDARIVAPPERFAWAQAKAEEYIDGIRAAGYDVVGDLDELRPAPPQGPYVHPDEVAVTQVIGAAVEATARLALHMARMREAHGVGVPPGRATSSRRLRPALGSRLPVPARLRNSCERAVRKLRRTLSR
jgi:hypothetical protein